MSATLRDSPIGRCIRHVTRKRYCAYPEDSPDFALPEKYLIKQAEGTSSNNSSDNLEKPPPSSSTQAPLNSDAEVADLLSIKSRTTDVHEDFVIVGWYNENDPENPMNWTSLKKSWVTIILLAYVIAVYIGSSLYTASIEGLIEVFHVSQTAASAGLALYVFGYGVGALLFSPLSEIPAIGRNPPYAMTFFIFVILCIPGPLINDFAGILVLRFLLGFFGAPALATAGVSLGDFFPFHILPYMILSWTGGAILGPTVGPLISGFAVQAENWRWSFWELLWISGPVLILMLLLFPETSSDAILYRRAERLRALTGRTDIRSEADIRRSKMSVAQIAFDALVKPWEINILDPAVLFTTIYTALIYGIFYSFFESFPLVYQGVYGFNLGELGIAYLTVLVGVVLAVICYCSYLYFYARPRQAHISNIPPEEQIRPGLVATFAIPIGLFLFAWTSRPSIHWIVSMIGITIAMSGIFTIASCLMNYLPFTYPQYAGSLFAANNLARSCFAAAAILYSTPMFERLGVSGGVSLLAGLMILCTGGIYVLFIFGASLRKRSRFAVS